MAKRKSRGGLKNRYEQSYQTKDKGSGKRALNFDSETKFLKKEEGRKKIIIVPYEIKTKNPPLVKSGDAEIGELDYKIEIYVHRSIGPRNDNFICLSETYGKRCPICERQKEYSKDSEEYSALKPQRRVVYNVIDIRDNKEMKIFDESHYLFEKELIEEARAEAKDGDILGFADPDNPYVISFRASTKKFNGREFFEYKSIKFLESDIDIDSLIEDTVSLDECLNVLSFEEITSVIEGFDEEDEEDEEEQVTRKKKTTKKKSQEEEEDYEDEEDEDEEEPPKKESKSQKRRKKTQKANKCPHGHTFGDDCEEHDECDKCEKWEECEEASGLSD